MNIRRMRPDAETKRQGRILVFDERDDELQRVGAMLAAEGYKVQLCTSFSDAIDHLTDESFDIVVIGQEAGLEEEGEVAEWARAADSRLPVLMLLTDEKDVPGEGTRWRSDVSEFLRKPVTVVEVSHLKEAVRRHVKPKVAAATGSKNPS